MSYFMQALEIPHGLSKISPDHKE